MQDALSSAAVASQFIGCLGRAKAATWPYNYWLLDTALPERVIDDIVALPFAAPDAPVFDGRREANNSTRVYFSPQMQARFPVCREVARAFKEPAVLDAIKATTGRDVSKGHLRVEYCQDTDGFWLEPHVDIPVKLYTMLVYLSGEPELRDAGTEVYDASPEHKTVATAPYERNKGLIFIPGTDTWHGFRKRPIRGVRKSIIINYVADAWRAKEELA